MILLASTFTKSSITADTAFRKDLSLQGGTTVNPYTFDQPSKKVGSHNTTLSFTATSPRSHGSYAGPGQKGETTPLRTNRPRPICM